MTRSFVAEVGTADRKLPVRACSYDDDPSVWLFPSIGEYPTLGGSEGAGAVLRDARERLVKPDGRFVPHVSVTTVVGLDLGSVTAEPPSFPTFVLD